MDTNRETPNVFTQAGLQDIIQQGYLLEIVCTEEARHRNNVWVGIWIIRAVNAEGVEKHLATARGRRPGHVVFREFKTVTGLISFLREAGCSVANIPLYEGDRATCLISKNRDSDAR